MRIAYFLTHPSQNQTPFIRELIGQGLDITTIYGAAPGATGFQDPDFRQRITWDVPLLEGHPFTAFDTTSRELPPRQSFEWFRSRIEEYLTREKPDVAWVHGWSHAFCRAALSVAKSLGIPIVLRGETNLQCVKGGVLRRAAHRFYYSRRFRSIGGFFSIGTLNHELLRSYGVPEESISLVPYTVDNSFFAHAADVPAAEVQQLRESLGIQADCPVLLFGGKLIPEKDVATLIRALAILRDQWPADSGAPPVLVVAGDGPQRGSLTRLANETAPNAVKMPGFVNQSRLPAFYALADLFVLPSVFEPWGLVVNEAMAAGKPVIVSDAVGCRPDLVKPGVNGDIFPAGNVEALAALLARWLKNRFGRGSAGAASRAIVNEWNTRCDVARMKQLFAKVMTTTSSS